MKPPMKASGPVRPRHTKPLRTPDAAELKADPRGVLTHLTGAPRAVNDIEGCRCRWPLGEPASEKFVFCSAVIEKPVIVGSTGLKRPNPYCEAHRQDAKGKPERIPPNLGRTAAPGFGVAQPATRLRAGRTPA